ncbi:MAG: hypothetical protein RLZZ418_886 [Pseudomonadota bacterium]|jgi:hypothetical protein
MKKAIFLNDVSGSINGITVKDFVKDSIYNVDGLELNEFLFKSWKNKGIVKEFIEEKMLSKFENKAIFSSSENKEEEITSEIVEEVSENKEEEIKINNKKKGKK